MLKHTHTHTSYEKVFQAFNVSLKPLTFS